MASYFEILPGIQKLWSGHDSTDEYMNLCTCTAQTSISLYYIFSSIVKQAMSISNMFLEPSSTKQWR